MRRNFLKYIVGFLGFCTLFASVTPIYAAEKETPTIHYIPDNLVEEGLQKDIDRIMSERQGTSSRSIGTREVPQYSKYDYVQVETRYPSAVGYIGNQPPGGVYFQNGGTLYWQPDGGPSLSVSVSFSVEVVSVGISLGNLSSSYTGYNINIPAGAYYKVSVNKKMKVVKTAVYGYPISGGARQFLYYIYPSSLYSYAFTPVRVN